MTTSRVAFEVMDQDGRVVLSVAHPHAFQPGAPAPATVPKEVGYSWRWILAWFLTGAAAGSIITAIIDRLI